jgi:hypothetical protein
MKSIRVPLVQRQRLLATQLGLGKSSRLKMREASLAKRRRRDLSGLFGRHPALSAIHERLEIVALRADDLERWKSLQSRN